MLCEMRWEVSITVPLNSIFGLRMRIFNCIKVKYSTGYKTTTFIHTVRATLLLLLGSVQVAGWTAGSPNSPQQFL